MSGISPNNDGQNDVWKLFGIENLGDNKVAIYTRWGELIYETSNYDNDSNYWNGEMNKGSGNGKVAMEGIYYYVIEVNNKVYKGTVTIN